MTITLPGMLASSHAARQPGPRWGPSALASCFFKFKSGSAEPLTTRVAPRAEATGCCLAVLSVQLRLPLHLGTRQQPIPRPRHGPLWTAQRPRALLALGTLCPAPACGLGTPPSASRGGAAGRSPRPPHTQVHAPADRAPPQVKPPPASPLPT